MLQPNGQRILALIGKDDHAASGIVLPSQMAAAIAKLEAAVIQEELSHQKLRQQAESRDEPAPRFETISLRQRSLPFLDMLRRSLREDQEIVWGV